MTVALHISEADTCCLYWPESSLFYFVYIIRLISLTSPAVECIWKGFFFHALSCPGMCNEILSSVLKTLGVPVVFTFEVFL